MPIHPHPHPHLIPQLMTIGDADKKVEFVEHWQGQPLVATTCITCMDVIKQTVDEVRGRSVGREGSRESVGRGSCQVWKQEACVETLQKHEMFTLHKMPSLYKLSPLTISHYSHSFYVPAVYVTNCNSPPLHCLQPCASHALSRCPLSQPDAISSIVVGTESGRVLILNPQVWGGV